jgi:arylformamidase
MTGKPDYFDISPVISEATAVFPGDTPFQRNVLLDFKKGDHLLLSSMTTTVHLGAHADGPNHYDPNGIGIGERDLLPYMGRAQVITTGAPRGERIEMRHLPTIEISAPRVLFRTLSFINPNQWVADFNSVSVEVLDFLATKGVVLVGIDTPSVDPSDSKALEAHTAIAKHGFAILEGLVLDEIKDGLYTLIALPLRLQGVDASPVRAILMKDAQGLL